MMPRNFLSSLLAMIALLAVCPEAMAQGPGRRWKLEDGRIWDGSYVTLNGNRLTLQLEGGKTAETSLRDLTWESARQAIADKWDPGRLVSRGMALPGRVAAAREASECRMVSGKEASGLRKGWTRYRCAHFDFDSQAALPPKVLAETARVFESTKTLLEALPWHIEATPLSGSRFQATLYKDLASYHAAGNPRQSAGVFNAASGDIHLPALPGGDGGIFRPGDILQHELTHQMMQRFLPVMPWWVAEGCAEYVRVIEYRKGSYDGQSLSRRLVLPVLQQEADRCTGDAFARALAFHTVSQAELRLNEMARAAAETEQKWRAQMTAGEARVRANFARLEDLKNRYVFMFNLPDGDACVLPEGPAPLPPAEKIPPAPVRNKPGPEIPGAEVSRFYAASTLMVFYLNNLAPDKGASFARYLWGVQQLSDEFDQSMQRYGRAMDRFKETLARLDLLMREVDGIVAKKAAEYEAYFQSARDHIKTSGHLERRDGIWHFVHTPDGKTPAPVPPEQLNLKLPAIPVPPAPLLTAGEMKKRRELLLEGLFGPQGTESFIATVKAGLRGAGIKGL